MAHIASVFEPAKDASPADWIVGAVKPWGKDRVRLWSFLPEGYERYVRVFHPAHRTEGDPAPVRWSRLADASGVVLRPDIGFQQVSGLDPSDQQAWYDAAPNEGTLEREQVASLATILEPFTETPGLCWVAVWEGWGTWQAGSSAILVAFRNDDAQSLAPTPRGKEIDVRALPRFEIPNRSYYLFSGRVSDVQSFEIGAWHQAPSIWWPDDRAWCVATEVDGYSTYVGGSSRAIEALLASEEVETIEVTADVPFDPGAY